MDTAKLKDAIVLSGRLKHVFVATVDSGAVPHIAVAGRLAMQGELLGVSAWYCPQTLANIEKCRQIAVAVWDKSEDTGFQLIGRCERIEDMAVMDGYAPKVESPGAFPQTEKQLLVRVEKVFHFTQARHSDK
jgi:hypothetical protein